MQTRVYTISEVLNSSSSSFYIPPFQRSYAWGKTEIDRFFDDINRIIASELNNNERDKLQHFFGTLVLQKEKTDLQNCSIVIDGQQRLTTALLFLIALRDLEDNEVNQQKINQNFLLNNNSDYEHKIKLKQVTSDWEAYKALVLKNIHKPGMITNAYKYFYQQLKYNKAYSLASFNNYITALDRMNVAVIYLDQRPYMGEDPQLIFETLNSLGKPLTLADLIRNYILLKMDSNSQTKAYEHIWYPSIENVLKDYTSKFFRDYLQLKKSISIKVVSDSNTKEIYQIFKIFVEEQFSNRDDFISDIIKYAEWYSWIVSEEIKIKISNENSKNREILELLRNIFHDIKSEAFKPFVLGLLEFHQDKTKEIQLSDDRLIEILKTIRTYLIRRRIIGLTQGENKNIVLKCESIHDLVNGSINMIEILSSMFYSLRMPNNLEMRKVLEELNFYEGLKKYSKFILGKIEEYQTKVAVDFRDKAITIEHIMPQTLNEEWKKELGKNYDDIHKKYLHNIGNLILTEFNSEIGNKVFSNKKFRLRESSLSFRLDVMYKDCWNEDSILKHRNVMINKLLNTFSLPTQYKEQDNWKISKIESSSIFPFDDDAGERAEGSKPSAIIINTKLYHVKSWRDVIVHFFKYIREFQDYHFDFIMDNQIELFSNDNTIINWRQLKLLLEENVELGKRFKTLENRFYDKVENLTEETIFIHVNIAASLCISRICSVMDKLSLPEDSVEIMIQLDNKSK